MMKINLILIFICAEIFFINCYTINQFQRYPWSDYDVESIDVFLAKLIQLENLFQNENLPISSLDQSDGHSRHLQKRGRQCLWKVCSWALDKRSPSSNPSNGLEKKLLY
ncbi:unnamed protein product [Rotaria sordida]|uniref:Uncharacterized protein n=1 Tax=Rotaria sordida TaxID=392033 RepID=A0A813XUX1_9BILA|nr:unnamed protein product [Rotaria sordida]CAF0784159.1 unnamed protein product [Rotaria sordida]CAF0815608.1 unnamed protein product [Rotaria sordida]CAF0842995.1 unnamed protein product [Rotaria sordida]CAF0878730.1 unnamed protein product [Rotaria sordida]